MIRPQLVCDRCGATCATGEPVRRLRIVSKEIGWTVRGYTVSRNGALAHGRNDFCPWCSEQFEVERLKRFDLAIRAMLAKKDQ